MPIDWSNIQQKAQQRQKSSDDKRTNRLVDILNAVDQRLTLNAHDEVIDVVEILLGVKPGSIDDVAAMLGLNADDTDDQPALPAPAERPLPVFNADGSPAGVAMREEQAINAGYAHKVDDTGAHIGWQKPPTVDATAVNPTVTEADRQVDLRDKKGNVIGQIKVGDGVQRDDLEAKLKPDLTVEYFQMKPRWIKR